MANNPEFYEYLNEAPWGSVWDARGFNEQWLEHVPPFQLRRGQPAERVGNRSLALLRGLGEYPPGAADVRLCMPGSSRAALECLAPSNDSRGIHFAAEGYAMRSRFGTRSSLLLAAAGLAFLGRQIVHSPWAWGTLLVLSLTVVHTMYWTDMRMRAP